MKKVMTILIVVISYSIFLTSCDQGSNNDNPNSSMSEKETNNEIDTFTTSKEQVSIPTIKIGQQEWMTDDINAVLYNNGDAINEAKSEKQWRDYGKKKIGCYRKLTNGTFVYNGYAVNDERGIIPSGFLLPSYDQFKQLMKFLGDGDSQSGKATQSMATYSIYIEDWVGDQETGGLEDVEIKSNGNSGFNAKIGGFVYDHGAKGNEGNCSFWWTSSSEGTDQIGVDIGYCSQDLGGGKGSFPLTFGFAVRAIKK